MSKTDNIAERGIPVRLAGLVAIHVVLAPLLILLGIREAINWVAVDRRWTRALIVAADRLCEWSTGRSALSRGALHPRRVPPTTPEER